MANLYSLVLTGDILPATDPKTVWSDLATLLGVEEKALMEKMARAPFIIKQDENLELIQTMWAEVTRAGMRSQICSLDDQPQMFVILNNIPRGPIPKSYLDDRIQNGIWPNTVSVAIAGSSQWSPYAQRVGGNSGTDNTIMTSPAVASPLFQTPFSPPSTASAVTPDPFANQTPGTKGFTIFAPSSPPSTPVGQYAGFWKRFAAAWIDGFILLIPTLVLLRMHFFGFILLIIGSWLYHVFMETSARQGSVGKMVLHIKVVDLKGNRLQFGRATGRHFAKILSSFAFCVGFMLAGWTQQKQGLHDIIAGTLVINDPNVYQR